MLIGYSEFKEEMVADYRAVIFAEDHNSFSPFVKKMVKLHNPDVFLTEHIAYATLDMKKCHSYDLAISHLKDGRIPYTGYFKSLYNALSGSSVKEMIGCDYIPDGINPSERRERFIEVVDRLPIRKSFLLRERHMETALSRAYANKSKRIMASIGGEHIRTVNTGEYPTAIPPLVKKYQSKDDVIIVAFDSMVGGEK